MRTRYLVTEKPLLYLSGFQSESIDEDWDSVLSDKVKSLKILFKIFILFYLP